MGDLTPNLLRRLKRKGLSDARIAKLMGVSEKQFRKTRWNMGIYPVYKRVDTVPLSLKHQPLICTQHMMKSARLTHQIKKNHGHRWRPQPYRTRH